MSVLGALVKVVAITGAEWTINQRHPVGEVKAMTVPLHSAGHTYTCWLIHNIVTSFCLLFVLLLSYFLLFIVIFFLLISLFQFILFILSQSCQFSLLLCLPPFFPDFSLLEHVLKFSSLLIKISCECLILT